MTTYDITGRALSPITELTTPRSIPLDLTDRDYASDAETEMPRWDELLEGGDDEASSVHTDDSTGTITQLEALQLAPPLPVNMMPSPPTPPKRSPDRPSPPPTSPVEPIAITNDPKSVPFPDSAEKPTRPRLTSTPAYSSLPNAIPTKETLLSSPNTFGSTNDESPSNSYIGLNTLRPKSAHELLKPTMLKIDTGMEKEHDEDTDDDAGIAGIGARGRSRPLLNSRPSSFHASRLEDIHVPLSPDGRVLEIPPLDLDPRPRYVSQHSHPTLHNIPALPFLDSDPLYTGSRRNSPRSSKTPPSSRPSSLLGFRPASYHGSRSGLKTPPISRGASSTALDDLRLLMVSSPAASSANLINPASTEDMEAYNALSELRQANAIGSNIEEDFAPKEVDAEPTPPSLASRLTLDFYPSQIALPIRSKTLPTFAQSTKRSQSIRRKIVPNILSQFFGSPLEPFDDSRPKRRLSKQRRRLSSRTSSRTVRAKSPVVESDQTSGDDGVPTETAIRASGTFGIKDDGSLLSDIINDAVNSSPLGPFPAGTANGMSMSSTGSVKSININRVLYIENFSETLIEQQIEPQTPTEGENQDHTANDPTYPAISPSEFEQNRMHSSEYEQPHDATLQSYPLPPLQAPVLPAIEDLHSPFHSSGVDGLASDPAREDQEMRDSAQTDSFMAEQPVLNDPIAIIFGRDSGRVVMLGENKSTPAVVSSSVANPRPLPSPPTVVALVDGMQSQKVNMVDLPLSTQSSFIDGHDARRFNWNGPASDGHYTETVGATAGSDESHNTAASAPQLHLPPPPSVPPPASSSSHTTTAPADLPLLMASHLLSTHAAALMQNSNNLKDLGELMHRMARESLDWGSVLMGMTMKGGDNQVRSEEDRLPNPFPLEGPPSSAERQRGEEQDREVLVTPDVGEAVAETDRLTPIPTRPSVSRIRSQSKFTATSDTHTTPPQHDLSRLAAAGQADIQASIHWLDEAERLGREGWTSINQAEAAWMNAMSSLRAMVNSTQAQALALQPPRQGTSEGASSSPLQSSNDHSTGYTENDLGFESPLNRKSTNHARPGSRMTGRSATRVISGSGSGSGPGRKLSKRSGPVTTSVREIRLGQKDERNLKGKKHWWSRRRSGSMSTLRA